MELPPPPSKQVLEDAEVYVRSLSAINGAFKNSPFNLGSIEDRKLRAIIQDSLASVVTLDSDYFPRELYSEEQRRYALIDLATL